MNFNVEEFEYRIYRGRLKSYVARANDPPQRIIKSIRTFMSRGRIHPADVDRMLKEIEKESVLPFLRSPWNLANRESRFEVIKDGLIARRV